MRDNQGTACPGKGRETLAGAQIRLFPRRVKSRLKTPGDKASLFR